MKFQQTNACSKLTIETLEQGVNMLKVNNRKSNNRKLKLIFPKHGNLEILCRSYSWSNGTYGYNIDVLHFNSKDQLLILILQDERNLALYDYNSRPLWVTSTNGKFIETKNAIVFEELNCTISRKLDIKSIFSPINILYLKEVMQKRN